MSKKSMREEYGYTLVELGKFDDKIMVVDADLANSTRTELFKNIYPNRFIDVGIAEQNMVGVAGGLASTGKKVFASSYAVFLTGRPYEMIRNTVCMGNINVNLVATHAGLMTGTDGGTHQSIEDIAIMRVLPNMHVFVPADAHEAKQIIKKCPEINSPTYVRLVRGEVEDIYGEDYEFEVGKGSIILNGEDVTLIACGPMVHEAVEASHALIKDGIRAKVVNMSSIKPIDKELIIQCAKETELIITIEDHSVIGGLGSAVSEVVCENYPVKVKKMGVNDVFGESANPIDLYEKHKLTSKDIIENVKELLEERFI